MTSREQDNAWTLSTLVTATWAAPSYTITFYKDGQGQIGKLDFSGPAMVFEGDAEESARVFFDYIATRFKGRLEAERQAAIQHARDVAAEIVLRELDDNGQARAINDAIKEALK